MALNEDEHHPAHSVSDYFEVLKMRYPSLFLLRDELEKPEIKAPQQIESATINQPRARGGQGEPRVFSQDNRANKEQEIKRRNFMIFNKAFPGQKKYQLDKEKRSTRVDISLLPDTYFATFIINTLLIAAVLVFFFFTRTVSEEYFIRKNINNVFEKENMLIFTDDGKEYLMDLQPFSSISSTDTFAKYMIDTLPYTIFTPDSDDRLQFSRQNPALGPLKIRVQHLDKDECSYNPIFSSDLTTSCAYGQNNDDSQMKGFITVPTSPLLPD